MEIDMPDLDSSIFKINLPTGKPAVGSLLVAEPFLREEYFNHGIISLVEYERGKSAMGLVGAVIVMSTVRSPESERSILYMSPRL